MKKLYVGIVTLLASITLNPIFSQSYLGLSNSNYAGTQGIDLQPASFVDGRLLVDVNLFSTNIGLWQNAKYFDTKNMPKGWVKSFQEPNTAWLDDEHFYENNIFDVKNKRNAKRGLNLSSQLDILNFAFHISPIRSVGFSFKLRNNLSVSKVTPEVIKLAEEGLDYSLLWGMDLKDENISFDYMSWAEFGFNYAQVVFDNNEHMIKVGGNLKFLQGISSAYFRSKDFAYNLKDTETANYLRGEFDYGYSKNVDQLLADGEVNMNTIFSSKLGLGVDLGVVYEWRPDWKEYKHDMDGEKNIWKKSKEKYKLRAGLSLVDMGGMKFEKSDNSKNFKIDKVNYDLHKFEDIEDLESLNDFIDDEFESLSDSRTYVMSLPAAISGQLDYHIWDNFYANFTGYVNMISSGKAHRIYVPTQLSITPRYDHKYFGLFLPLSWNNYSGFKTGLAVRLGPVFFGFTDWNSILAKGKVRGTELYFGVKIPIYRRDPKDRDGDGVSDRKDKCKDVPGLWEFQGCPDTDGDGVQDSEDDCPTEPGLKSLKGCPDADDDGIPDHLDKCPDEFGPIELGGCPDRDGDGIPDKDDECPDVPGIREFNGCPDTDGDGVPDSEDMCPDVPGLKEFQGCPDTDGDGIPDHLDACPTLQGPREYDGCPDTDGDGIPDHKDKCPTQKGPAENNGCPWSDRDGDGVPDKDDECPDVAGPKENKGCPVIEKEEEEVLQTAFDNLEFETAKAIIKDRSLPSLDELAALLIKKGDWRLQISGHTDNVGKPQANLVLSKQRAEAVRDYLSSKGIDMSRFSVLYFGDTQPIAPNDTPEGRQKNRRVEMQVIFK